MTSLQNQLKENNPPETNLTLLRLINNGHSESEAIEMIAGVIASDVYYILKRPLEI